MMRGLFIKKCLVIVAALLCLPSFRTPSFAASDEDAQTLGLYYEPSDLVVTATRNPIPLSQAAENITVITAKEIEMMGAHTLVDIFANVPGIQASDQGGPGTLNDFFIQGASATHILLMLDGVTLNPMASQLIDLRGIPIQNIERIEIVKGPGSSSWGSALGAVINIVTKSPIEDKKLGGTLSFTGGERGTRDSRGEISGTTGPFGYYLFAGNLTSHGFRPNTAVDQNDFYGKLRWELPTRGSLQFTIAYDRGFAGNGDLLPIFNALDGLRKRNFLSTLSFNCPITDKIDFDLSLRTRYLKTTDYWISGDYFPDVNARETSYGGSARLTWRSAANNTLTGGFDYDYLDISSDANGGSGETVKLFSDKYGVFLNDTLVLGDFAFTPGIRYDRMRPVGDFYSPSFGVAWNPTEKVTLRAYWARGYSLPILTAGSTQQKVNTVQAGVETTYIPMLWLKGTFFWNQLSDVQESIHNQLKQGMEVEAKSIPIFNTSASAGYTFVDARDRDTGAILSDTPSQIIKLGLHYDDEQHSFRGSLLGRYVWYNATFGLNARDKAFIWDLNLAKKVLDYHGTTLELSLSVHNLFNGAQYSFDAFKNARRWVEGGIKFNF